MSNRNNVILTSLMALGLAACGEKPEAHTDAIAAFDAKTAETALKSGCIQGVVLNGLTGEAYNSALERETGALINECQSGDETT